MSLTTDQGRGQLRQGLAQQSDAAFREAARTVDPDEKGRLLQVAQRLAGLSALADSYTHLQQTVGLIAVTLPFVVAIGNLIAGGHGVKGSISSYYYTHMGTYFVGSLFALGVFFMSYNYRPLPNYRWDNILSNLAGLMAVGVALLPTASDAKHGSTGSKIVSGLHLGFACTLFVLLAVFALFLFTQTDPTKAMTQYKRRRNRLYRVCGVIIVAAIVLVLVSVAVHPSSSWHTLFWLESVAVVAFGVSWLVKGGLLGILTDS